MKEAAQPVKTVRFGAFELDLRSGELRKQGVRIKLQEQPFQVLAILVEHSGEVVTREELRTRLWPEDTFVDFEHSLATAINKVRDALGDAVQSPRFIETLPKRGYRFIAPVEAVSPGSVPEGQQGERASQAPPVAPDGSPIDLVNHAGAELSTNPQGLSLGSAARRGLLVAAAGVLTLGTLVIFNVAGIRNRLVRPGAIHASSVHIKSIAVLPLENLSRDPDEDYFADGMTDELIATLARVQSLRVVSRTSVRQYKKTNKPSRQIGRELNVDAIVEGTVVHSGGRVRITAELVEAATDRHLWADNFESDERDVLVLQSELARAIVDEIHGRLEPQEQARLASALPINPKAHQAYLEGRFFYYRETNVDLPKAIQYTQRAIQLAPNYAPAYALLAACFYDSSESRWGDVPNAEAAQKAAATALKGLELDPSLAEPHVVLAAVHEAQDWDWAGAEREFRRAIELDPSLVNAHVGLAWHLIFMKRDAEAIQEMTRAMELDPVSAYTLTHEIFILYLARHYDEAIEGAHRLLELHPDELDTKWTYGVLAGCFEAKAMRDEEVAALQKEMVLAGRAEDARALGRAYKAGGITGVWRWQLEKAKKDAARGEADPTGLASLYSLLGEKAKAFEWLERAYPRRGQDLLFVRVDPVYDNLRSDPRYQDLMRRMNFPAH